MVKLSPAQIEYINREMNTLERIIESKPKEGLLKYHMQYYGLQAIVKVHNVEAVKKQ